MQMKTKTFSVGMFSTNCHVVFCHVTGKAVIIDPGSDEQQETERILKFIDENALKPTLVINTHGHPDHTCGNATFKKAFNIPILVHKKDEHMFGMHGKAIAQSLGFSNCSPQADRYLEDGNVVSFGNENLKVIHTPGHTCGSICLLGQNEIFTGDTLFAGSIGRTDFPESSEKDMTQSLKKLASLPDCLAVFPGHGPTTTMGEEKQSNPFLTALFQ
jgi:glyoxylase-like metal-dependent hydrolase (beta-lactamase superfamily II)